MTLQTNQGLDAARLRRAFGNFPSGVVAVAAEVDGRPVGLAASLGPPRPAVVPFSVANTSKTWPDLRRTSHLGVDGAVTLDEGLAREVEAGDHLIVLLRLHAVEHPETGNPLIFHRSGFGRLAETA